jgi:hypothetical protein
MNDTVVKTEKYLELKRKAQVYDELKVLLEDLKTSKNEDRLFVFLLKNII